LTVSVFIVPLTEKAEDADKCKVMLDRLRMVCRDAQPILKKYKLVEKFALKK
jgi:hypothetical protein